MPVQRLTPERRRELTRTALVEAAAEVFARRGFEGASLEEIAEVAGFTRGAIYSNFGSKEDLLLAVVERHNQALLDAFADTFDRQADASQEEWSGSAALLWRDLIRGDPTLTPLNLEFRLYALRNPPFRKRLVEVQRQYVSRIADFIDRISNTLGLRLKISAADLAEITNAATLGLTELASVDVEQAERYDRLVEQFFRLMMEATIEATPTSSSSKRRRG